MCVVLVAAGALFLVFCAVVIALATCGVIKDDVDDGTGDDLLT